MLKKELYDVLYYACLLENCYKLKCELNKKGDKELKNQNVIRVNNWKEIEEILLKEMNYF